MKKYLLLLFVGTMFCFNLVAQDKQNTLNSINKQNTLDSINRELAKLTICRDFSSNNKDIIESRKNKGNQAIVVLKPDVLPYQFLKFCQGYSQTIVEFERRNLDNYEKTNSPVTNNHIIYSSGNQNNKTEINMYYETVSSRPQVLPVSKRPRVDAIEKTVSQRPKVDKVDVDRAELKLQLEKVKNTKKLYQDLANTLQHQMNYNLVETVDNTGDLLLKHVSIPQGEALKTKPMEEIKKAAGVENEKPIKNTVADIVNLVVDGSEKIVELVPVGDILTNHYLWKLFKSTPEAGKGLGHLAASINIYFRKSEYADKIKELENYEQQLVKMLE